MACFLVYDSIISKGYFLYKPLCRKHCFSRQMSANYSAKTLSSKGFEPITIHLQRCTRLFKSQGNVIREEGDILLEDDSSDYKH